MPRPSKPGQPSDTPRRRRRKARLEDHPDVRAWCERFVADTENVQGYTPTTEQAVQAFLVAALRALGEEARHTVSTNSPQEG